MAARQAPMGKGKITLEVTNVHEVREKIAMLPEEVENRISAALDDALDAVATEARDLVPKDTGELHDSIHEERITTLTGFVRATARHAPFIEFGTSSIVATPYMFPAIERERRVFRQRVIDMMQGLGG